MNARHGRGPKASEPDTLTTRQLGTLKLSNTLTPGKVTARRIVPLRVALVTLSAASVGGTSAMRLDASSRTAARLVACKAAQVAVMAGSATGSGAGVAGGHLPPRGIGPMPNPTAAHDGVVRSGPAEPSCGSPRL